MTQQKTESETTKEKPKEIEAYTIKPPKKTRKWLIILILSILTTIGILHYFWENPDILPPNMALWIYQQKEEMDIPFQPPHEGFYKGIPLPNKVRLFIFYEHPQYGLDWIEKGETLRTNTLKLIFYYHKETEIPLTLKSFRYKYQLQTEIIKTEEGKAQTITKVVRVKEPISEDTYRFTIQPFKFDEKEIGFKTETHKTYYEIWYENTKIFEFIHKTYPAWVLAPPLRWGIVFQQITSHIALTVVICFLALITAKWLILAKIRYVPDLPAWAFFGLTLLLIGAIGFGFMYSYFINAETIWYTYIPVYASFLILSCYLLRESPHLYLMVKDTYDNIGDKIIRQLVFLNVLEERGTVKICPQSWKELIFKPTRQLIFHPQDRFWYFDILFQPIKMFYIQDMEEKEDGNLHVQLAESHKIEVEKFMLSLKRMDVVAQTKNRIEREYAKLFAEMDKRTWESVKEVLERLGEARYTMIKGEKEE